MGKVTSMVVVLDATSDRCRIVKHIILTAKAKFKTASNIMHRTKKFKNKIRVIAIHSLENHLSRTHQMQ